MTSPAELSLCEAAERIRSRALSSREVTAACVERIDRHAGALNCFIRFDADQALAQADAADRALAAGDPVGSLHGVPLAHKDMFYRAGVVCTCGSKIRRDFVPDRTATVLRRLDAAGALDVGALNLSEFAHGPTGHNAHFGACRNAWNPEHISGGSSSGSGTSVAARLVFGALGSDTGGSIRLPAAANGLVGVKPTQTRVSRHAMMGLSFSLDNAGPLTRTVRDAARLLGVIAGHDPEDPTSSPLPVPDYEAATLDPEGRLCGLRIGVPRNYYYDTVVPEVKALLDGSLRELAGLGAEIVEVTVPHHEHVAHLQHVVQTSEAATLHADWLADRGADYGPQVRARIQPGLATPAPWYLRALQLRPRIVADFVEQVFGACDVLHLPVFPAPVPTIEETDVGASREFTRIIAGIVRCTLPINFLTCPSIVMPAGFTGNGLPGAFQLAGRPFDEATLFRAAAAYEAATGFPARAPDLPPRT